MSTQPENSGTIPLVPNPRRLPTVELTDSVKMFAGKNMLLGDTHQLDPEIAGGVPCGAACPHRLASISCPFFRAPCLVGCTVKQVLAGEGMQYEEQDFFVVAQAGRDLIGEEVVVSLDNPRAVRLRVVRDKRGAYVFADDGLSGSLLDGADFEDADEPSNSLREGNNGSERPSAGDNRSEGAGPGGQAAASGR